ncbi:uncharacterized protein N0V89_011229 [Didymosphaeria variabile]|uniref:Uncharacterized protein n=1 Tax=Didymosphaeria variabile TaxID=1932322 RepID=A0A9W8XCP8_9PLEO|nr:uncharacterized protein N0V89_011229 [Didymosphaeria variabile]KAJ4347289.1 hypothetical protein N0V89_011229 [Didymosphaeria variabile]
MTIFANLSRADRLGALHSNSSIDVAPPPSQGVPVPIHSVRSAEAPIQPEPVKPASEKSVMFDLQPEERVFTPEGEGGKGPERSRDREYERERERESGRDGGRRKDRERDRHRDRDRGRRDESPDDTSDSDATIELPPRFDERGAVRDDDPLASKLESVLNGLFR